MAGPVLRTYVQYLVVFCSRLEVASDVVGRACGAVVPDNLVQFCDPRLNRIEKFHPKPSEEAFWAFLR